MLGGGLTSTEPPSILPMDSFQPDPTSTGPRQSDDGGGGNRSDQGERTIELVEVSPDMVVQSGQPVMIGGTEGSAEVMRQFCIVLKAEAS